MAKLLVIGCGGVAQVAIQKCCQNDAPLDYPSARSAFFPLPFICISFYRNPLIFFRDTFAVVPKFPCLSFFKIQRKVNPYVLEESEIRFLPVNTNLFNKAIKIYSSQWS